jgi:Zn-dependent peptidase ImmA (M78 family)
VEEARGFTLYGEVPVIVISEHDSDVARIFTIIHELCHVLMKVSSIYFDPAQQGGVQRQFVDLEKKCNAFAASFLMPAADFKQMIEKINQDYDKWTNLDVVKIANKFKTSKEAVLRKLIEMDLVSGTYYSACKKYWKEEQEVKEAKDKEKQATAEKKTFGGMAAHEKVVREKGKTFATNVLQLYDNGKITALDAARFLDTKLDNFEKILGNLRSDK